MTNANPLTGNELQAASDAGRTFVHGLDTLHVDGVTAAADGVVGNAAFSSSRLINATAAGSNEPDARSTRVRCPA